MGELLNTVDVVIFLGSLLAVMALGLWAGRKEDTPADFYLAGRSTRWWGVAGSVFGSNVSANHIVGMMGVGFAVGFAQSHFEITAIVGLLMLCYLFLPVYRKLNLFTLSDYLSRRYDDRSRVAYALIMIAVMVLIQMVPGFYIGSRSILILLQGGPGPVDAMHFQIGILIMAAVTGSYTIAGGLKAVIITDVIQSILLLLAGLVVAFVTFSQPEVGGWAGMVAQDAAGADKLHLYNPVNHPELPWTGVLSGLMILHFYYWGTNQFIVQRALSARSDTEARMGIIGAGFFKLLIPFFSIGTGIAAYYLFQKRGMDVAQDAVFTTLLTELIQPIGFGLVGLVAAGMIGAILSSLDSMMNSAATIVTFDLYKRYLNPEASDRQLIRVGRIWIAIFIAVAAVISMVVMDPNSEDSFFLKIASHQGRLVAGVVVAFLGGMLWRKASGLAAFTAIVSGVLFSYSIPWIYVSTLGKVPAVSAVFGTELNFFHTTFLSALGSTALFIGISLQHPATPEQAKLTWIGLGLLNAKRLRALGRILALTLGLYALLAALMVYAGSPPLVCGLIAAVWTFTAFCRNALALRTLNGTTDKPLWLEDRLWGGALAACAVFLMYYFY